MRFFADDSIKRKLTRLVMFTSIFALLVAATLFVIHDVYAYRRAIVKDLTVLARIIGDNSASALDFGDPGTATDILHTLAARPHILSAAIYNEGELFARFGKAQVPDQPQPEGHLFANGSLLIFQPIYSGTDRLGTVYLQFDMVELNDRIKHYLLIVLAILAATIFIAYLFSARLQEGISGPILALARTAHEVSADRNYSLRAQKQTGGEIGFLIDRFNEMLEQIAGRDRELQEVNQQLLLSERRASEATQAKSQFLANMSHELRTPLTAIIGFSEMLLEEAQAEEKTDQAEDLARINDSAKHLLGLINGILDLSKIEAKKMELHLETFCINALVREVVNTVKPLLQKQSNHLPVHCPDNIGSMRADLIKVRQCLFNLLGNANKFTENGQVQLTVQRCPGPIDTIKFQVADNGIGMSPEQIGRLFQPFSQAETSTSKKFGGTGLGLAITKHFCEMMGGTVSVESELNRGTTFTLRIPTEPSGHSLPPSSVPAAAASRLPPGAPRPAPCILAVDDDPHVHRLVEMALKPEGFNVASAFNGREGLQKAKELKPDVITLDIMMPDTDGWSFLTELKADSELAGTPVIMLTVTEDRELGFALGASEYLQKPIDRSLLLELINKYVNDRSRGRVLVVDDNSGLRTMLRRTLEMEKWDVAEAVDGQDALEKISQRIPSIILLDLLMPGMDGFQLLAELQNHEPWRQIPVIVMTAKHLTEEDRQRLMGRTRQIFEKGSFVRERLVREVRDLVNNYQPTRGNLSV